MDIPTERTIVITGLRQGEAWINMTRIRGVDGTDLHSLTRGEIEGRRQIADIQRYLQEYVPGFKQSYLQSGSNGKRLFRVVDAKCGTVSANSWPALRNDNPKTGC